MDAQAPSPNLRAYLTVAQAAHVLGVSTSTLRNWDRQGKLCALRHPINTYRLYRRADLDRLLDLSPRYPTQASDAPA
jgi:DNA (cytosine-5)-methyltransferase 1